MKQYYMVLVYVLESLYRMDLLRDDLTRITMRNMQAMRITLLFHKGGEEAQKFYENATNER